MDRRSRLWAAPTLHVAVGLALKVAASALELLERLLRAVFGAGSGSTDRRLSAVGSRYPWLRRRLRQEAAVVLAVTEQLIGRDGEGGPGRQRGIRPLLLCLYQRYVRDRAAKDAGRVADAAGTDGPR